MSVSFWKSLYDVECAAGISQMQERPGGRGWLNTGQIKSRRGQLMSLALAGEHVSCSSARCWPSVDGRTFQAIQDMEIELMVILDPVLSCPPALLHLHSCRPCHGRQYLHVPCDRNISVPLCPGMCRPISSTVIARHVVRRSFLSAPRPVFCGTLRTRGLSLAVHIARARQCQRGFGEVVEIRDLVLDHVHSHIWRR